MIRIESFTNRDRDMMKKMIAFDWELYKDDENWVPPLKMELIGNKLLGVKGIWMYDHPYHSHSKTIYFMAYKGNDVVGHISATINHNHNLQHNEKVGFVGFFEAINDYEVAKALFSSAREWIANEGMEVMRGPANFTTNDPVGLLIKGFDSPPFLNMPYNPPYYVDFFERYGFKKAMDLIAQIMPVFWEDKSIGDRIKRVSEVISKRRGISVRLIDFSRFEEELLLIKEIYDTAWEKNWGFVKMTDEEFRLVAEGLKMIADPRLIMFAYVKGKLAAFMATLPNVNEVIMRKKSLFGNSDIVRLIRYFLNRKKIKGIRLMLFGIKPEYRKLGIDSVLYYHSFKNAQEAGYERCEISWLLETNILVIRAGESMGAKEYKRYRIYDYPL
jgi:GNAT superfamily N-acetyltransferase